MPEVIITIIASVLGSTGLWAVISKLIDKRKSNTKILVGLAYDRICTLCLQYIEQGSISKEEYENLIDFLYKPYEALGGNGTAKRLIEEVKKLPIQGENISGK